MLSFTFAETSGNLLAYVIGNFDFYAMSCFAIVITACGFSMYFLPESPLVLVKRNEIAVS